MNSEIGLFESPSSKIDLFEEAPLPAFGQERENKPAQAEI